MVVFVTADACHSHSERTEENDLQEQDFLLILHSFHGPLNGLSPLSLQSYPTIWCPEKGYFLFKETQSYLNSSNNLYECLQSTYVRMPHSQHKVSITGVTTIWLICKITLIIIVRKIMI
jgi:hypothetical protein